MFELGSTMYKDEQIDHRDVESVDSRIPLICLIFTFVIHKPVFFDRILKRREKKMFEIYNLFDW